MTADYSRAAVFDVRNAMWAALTTAGILVPTDYYTKTFNQSLIPIFPSQQIPEMNNLLPGKSYITYDIIQKPVGTQYWITEETMVLQLIAISNSQIISMANLITDFFRRFEHSAADVNVVAKASGSPFKFHYFRLEAANPTQPYTDEGGYMSGDLTFVYTYSRNLEATADTHRFI